jgi:hypothetical protein
VAEATFLCVLPLDQQISQCDIKQHFVLLRGTLVYNVRAGAKYHRNVLMKTKRIV